MLHQNARDVSHGALAPERILVTPNARVVLVEYVLGAAIESLAYSRERLWKDLRVAVPPGAGPARLNHRADVMQIGVVALALVLGRPLGDDDLRDLQALLASATENSVMGGREPISDALRRWLSRALQLDTRGAFESALEAQLALDDVLSGDAGYIAAPVALESFLTRYHECALKMAEWPAIAAKAPAIPVAPAAPFAPAAPVVPQASEAPKPSSLQVGPALAPVKVPPPSPKLGVARVSADAPAVPSFRAVATELKAPPVPAAPVAEAPEPAPAPPIAPSVVESAPEPESFDEATLRAQFIAASGAPETSRVTRRVRLVANGRAAVRGRGGLRRRVHRVAAGEQSVRLMGTNGTLKVSPSPMGAQVKIDGAVRGHHARCRCRLPAARTSWRSPRAPSLASFPSPLPPARRSRSTWSWSESPPWGRLSIQSSPVGATVLLDGQPEASHPLELPDVSAGDHELVLESRDSECARP
jgi:hypothetical protein